MQMVRTATRRVTFKLAIYFEQNADLSSENEMQPNRSEEQSLFKLDGKSISYDRVVRIRGAIRRGQ
jgi:hypothetical protein